MAYQTKDLYFAAALLAAGEKLEGTTQQTGQTHWFFVETLRIQEIEIEWVNDDLEVPARAYAEAVKNLKNMVFAAREPK